MVVETKDWFVLTIRLISFCIGFFIILDYIFTCNVQTNKGNIFMLSGMFLTIILFMIYRWSDIFSKKNTITAGISTNSTTSIDMLT